MEQYDHFYFIPLNKNQCETYDLYVNSDEYALLFRPTATALILEMQRPELVIACQEYLLHKADILGYDGIHRETTRRTLLKLIKELS